MRRLACLLLLFAVAACAPEVAVPSLDECAERYVKLNLALGEHDADWVDAYYGPAQWREEAKAAKKRIADIRREAAALRETVARTGVPSDRIEALRRNYILEQLGALITRAEMLGGKKFTFEEEARRLYGITPPRHDDAFFASTLAELEKALPGEGPLGERLERYRSRFHVPPDRVDAAMKAALEACRARTLARIPLPAGETFTLEYVKNQPWGGYNWYKGNFRSTIQVNTDLPLQIERVLGLACHEGYPGHHVYNVLLEKEMVRGRKWIEYTIYPLGSPQSLIAEGTGNYGVEMAFPGDGKMEFDRDVLFPLAGFDPGEAERYERVLELTSALAWATNEAARRWLNGEITREEAKAFLMRNALSTPERAEKRMRFIERYRSYVINYNVGRDLVARWIEQEKTPEARWKRFRELISTPMLPSNLVD